MTALFPIKEFRAGKIQASIWKNEKEKNGHTVVQQSVKIQKQYKRSDGEYTKTDYFFAEDLSNLVLVAQKAFEYISLKERNPSD